VNAIALAAFRDAFSGRVVLPNDPEYDSARAVWNGMIDRRPALVVRPTSSADVVEAVRFGRERDLDIAVKSGGHSIPGLSTCDDGIVIDLSAMRGAEVDPERRVARVKGGSLLGDLDEAAQAVGLVCPVGVVSHTGAAGLTLGGGMGRLQRRFGLTIDNLDSVEVVTAGGTTVRADETENPDLFWGIRGAGPNFGIVTTFEYRLHPLDNPVTHGLIVHPIDRAVELAGLLQETLEAGPDELWASYGLGFDGGEPRARLMIMHSGEPEAAGHDLAPLRGFGPPIEDTVELKPYLTTQRLQDEPLGWGHRFSMKSVFVPALSEELVSRCVEHVMNGRDGTDCAISVWACGGAVAEVLDDATAFTGRDGTFWLAAEAQWDDPELDGAGRAWARTAIDEVMPFASEGRYVNDVSEVGSDLRTVYGGAKYDRLVALKRVWDPDNVFRLNQNVKP
jgi:FAD binding domain/Berberine and berberine like